ncbi:MAG: class 1 fructose-bisphosphatase [Pseudomonadota bacterium]
MHERQELESFVDAWASGSELRSHVALTIIGMARASLRIRGRVACAPLECHAQLRERTAGQDAQAANIQSGDRGANAEAGLQVPGTPDGNGASSLDDDAMLEILEALRQAPVASVVSEQMDEPVGLDRNRRVLVVVDPLDGATNLDTNAAIGTIFSILPRPSGDIDIYSPEAFLQSGEKQLAAGFVVYGPRTSLVFTVREGTHVFTRDPQDDKFYLSTENVQIPPLAREYAINASNYRHWDEATRIYVDDCLKGREGIRATDFNMRWIGSLVAEIYRIFSRGGIYLYPADRRDGHAMGRLRLLHEANPISLVVENAGGAATTGRQRILEINPKTLHQRAPIVVGSRAEVEYVTRLYSQPHALGERSPLFGNRGLFRV